MRPGQNRDLPQGLQRVGALMWTLLKASCLAPDEPEIIRTRPHVVALRMLAAKDQGQFHVPPPTPGTGTLSSGR